MDGHKWQKQSGQASRKTARKTPARRQPAKSGLSSDKFRALVYNLSTQELDELIKVATGRKNEELASAKASFLDEVKARAATLGMSIADLVGLGGRPESRLDLLESNTAIPKRARPGPVAAVRQGGSRSSRRRGRKGKNSRFSLWHTNALLRYPMPWHRWRLLEPHNRRLIQFLLSKLSRLHPSYHLASGRAKDHR